MKVCWILLIFLLNLLKYVPINGDTYHYQVIRKSCPSGTYHDPIKDKCRRVPGGGEMLKINLDARCSGGFKGLLAHSKKSKYYYVCKSDGVLTCVCKEKERFNRILLKCENKCRKTEGLSHEVVDHIVDKYKCNIMNGVYEEGSCLLPITTNEPLSTIQSNDELDMNRISRLQNILKYLVFLKTLDSQQKSFEESVDVTSPIAPQTSIQPITTERSRRVSTQSVDPRNFISIDDEISNFRNKWNLDATTTSSVTEKNTNKDSLNPRVSGKSFKDSNKKIETTSIKIPLSTIPITSTPLTTTLPTTEKSGLESKNLANDMTTTTEDDTTTVTIDPITELDDQTTTLKPRVLKRLKDNQHELPSLEEYYEYYYEDEPEVVIKVSNTTKVKPEVKGKMFEDDQESDDWKQIVIITEPYQDTTLPLTTEEEYNEFETTTEVLNEETTETSVTTWEIFDENDLAEEAQTTTENVHETTFDDASFAEEIQTTTENVNETTIDDADYEDEVQTTTEIVDETTIDDVDFTEKIQTTTESVHDTTFKAQEEISNLAPEPLIRKYPGDLNFNDFEAVQKTNSQNDLSTTTEYTILSTNKDTETTTSDASATVISATTNIDTTTEILESTSILNEFLNDETIIEDSFLQKSFDYETTALGNEISTSTTDISSSTIENSDASIKGGNEETSTINMIPTTIESMDVYTTTSDNSKDVSETSTLENTVFTTATEKLSTTPENSESTETNPKMNGGMEIDDSTTVLPTTTNSQIFENETTRVFESTTSSKVFKTTENEKSDADLMSFSPITSTNLELIKTSESTPISILDNFTKQQQQKIIEDTQSIIPAKFEIVTERKLPRKSTTPASIQEKPEDTDSPKVEYYYSDEMYYVDEHGMEIKSQTKGDDFESPNLNKNEKVRKHKMRDNSNEYYAESQSASQERRVKDYFEFYY